MFFSHSLVSVRYSIVLLSTFSFFFLFFFNDTATTEIYTLSLHDALPISVSATLLVTNATGLFNGPAGLSLVPQPLSSVVDPDRKSTRLNSSHEWISYAVFCLKKKKKKEKHI